MKGYIANRRKVLFRWSRWPAMALAAGFPVILLGLAALVSAGLPAAKAESPSSRIVKQVGDDYYEWLKRESLGLRMRLGLRIERLPDLSPAKAEKDAAVAKAFQARLEKVNPGELTHEEALSFDILQCRSRDIIDSARFYWLEFPVLDSLSGVNIALGDFAFKDKAAADNYLELADRYAALVGQVRTKLDAQEKRGIVIPRPALEPTISYLRATIGEGDESSFAVKPIRLKALSTAEIDAFHTALLKIIEKKINPALKGLIVYLEGDYRKKAPESVGLGQYPGGKEYYAWLVRSHTTLDVTPEEVHKIGLREVGRLNAEIGKLQASLGFKGTRADFRQSVEKDARFFPKTPEEVGERLMAPIRRIEPFLDRYFQRKPKALYGVKRLAPELEGTMTFGYYQEPTAAEPVGYYLYNAGGLPERSLLDAAELIYHELVPGHHFQICLAREIAELPAFRRDSDDGAYAEGWAEYASSLAGEMGMYSDPYDLYGRISGGELFLSARLVVDTGMNALGWPLAKAEAFMRENTPYTDLQIHSEAIRYSVRSPGQALAYRMGHLKLRDLREKAQTALGEKFDIRRFHEALLCSGSMPLTTLERHIDWFITQEKQNQKVIFPFSVR